MTYAHDLCARSMRIRTLRRLYALTSTLVARLRYIDHLFRLFLAVRHRHDPRDTDCRRPGRRGARAGRKLGSGWLHHHGDGRRRRRWHGAARRHARTGRHARALISAHAAFQADAGVPGRAERRARFLNPITHLKPSARARRGGRATLPAFKCTSHAKRNIAPSSHLNILS